MLVTDVGDGRFRQQHPLSVKIGVGHRHSNDLTNIQILLRTPKNRHQHPFVINIYVAGYDWGRSWGSYQHKKD